MKRVVAFYLALSACTRPLPVPIVTPLPTPVPTVTYCTTYARVWPSDTCYDGIGRPLTTKDDYQCVVCHNDAGPIGGCVPKDIMVYCTIEYTNCGDPACAYRE